MCEEICRLCMYTVTQTQMLTDFYKNEGLMLRIRSCVGLKLNPDDGLSPFICKVCEQTINNFYYFKQKCLDINSKLRSSSNPKEHTLEYIKQDLENHYLEPWMEDQKSRVDFLDKYSEKDSGIETQQINHSGNTHSNDGTKFTNKTNNRIIECEKLLCEQCGNMFKSKQILEKHSVIHTGIRMFSCKLCPKQFTRAAHRVVHMRKHMGIKPYTCEICGKSSIKRQDLNRHLRIHSDEKKYPCQQCDKRFKRSSDVHSHMRTHTGARPYKCNECEKCYTSHSGLKKHLYRTHCRKDVKAK